VLSAPRAARRRREHHAVHGAPLPQGRHDFYVIDIPGERFLRAVEGSFLGESNTLMRHVIYTGQAFLTLLPADETLLSELAHDVLWRRAAAGGTAPADLASLPPPKL
jgi:hypothetical protein